jgi:PTS system mannose-specific IIB component/fructoselysine and glucoselysine-specific PTS system IIB component
LPVVLLRIDERLIHGQVVIGWGHHFRVDRYIVVDDELATSGWEQDLYRLGAGGAEVLFVTPAEAHVRMAEWREESARSIVLTRDVGTMLRLGEGGALKGESVNVGGVHHAPGRDELLTYVHLSEKERGDLVALSESGVDVSARDLPDAHKVSLSSLLGSRWNSFR